MAGVFRSVTLDWGGDSVVFTPSMDFLRRLEDSVTLVEISAALTGQKTATIATVVSACLVEGGAENASPEEVFAHMLQADDGAEALIGDCVNALFANVPGDEKKAKTPKAGAKKR